MATKNYMINDKWLDLDKQNIVELQSVDGVLDSMKVNGSEIVTPSGKITITENGTDIDVAQYALADVNVEGGGGSSDFSTAKVTIINNGYGGEPRFFAPNYYVDDGDSYITYMATIPDLETSNLEYNIVIFKDGYTNIGLNNQYSEGATFSISGDIVDDDEGYFIITGECTITIS